MNVNLYKLEFSLFFRNKSSWIGIFVLLFSGLAGLYFGKKFINQQQLVIDKAAIYQKKQTLHFVAHHQNDIGLLFYYHKFAVANVPAPLAAFANGQRDVNPYLLSVSLLALEGQLYDTDIYNPISLLFGNMDLSFVFIFLFPLVIIAFSYNILAGLKELSILPLLRAQSAKILPIILRKFVVRMVVILALSVLILLAAALYLTLPINPNFWFTVALIFIYIIFWFALNFYLVSLNRSSNFTASALIAIWVALCIVIPASLNLYLSKRYPVPEALQNVINQREGYHEKWDMPKAVTMEPFFKHYPQLRQYPFDDKKTFSWFWYYGMQQMGDDETIKSRNAVRQKLNQRMQLSRTAALFFPSIQVQLGINQLAGTDLNQHLAFQDEVRAYHEKLRLHFYPAIFKNEKINANEILKFGVKPCNVDSPLNMGLNYLSIVVISLFLNFGAIFNFKKI